MCKPEFAIKVYVHSTIFGPYLADRSSSPANSDILGTLVQSSFQWYPFCWVKIAEKFLGFRANQNFEARFRPIRDEFEGNDAILWIVTKNPSIWYIYCLCFVNVWKHALRDQNCYFNCYLDLRAGITGDRNQKVNMSMDLFRCHESHGGLRILKWASVRKLFFEVSNLAPFCMKIQFMHFQGSVLENEHTPRLVSMSRF